ncbi:MAG: serine/threonine-protein kinase, partial [Planctomycetota bacterium]
MNQASNPMGNNDDTGAIPREAVSERVEKLVQTFQDCRDRGSDATIEEVCAHDPEMVTAVRAWLTKVGNMEAMLATQAPTGSTLRGSWGEDNILSAPQAPDELGRLGGYRILKLIGQGGMGKVYLAEDIKLKRRVAVKVLLKGGDKRFLREAQTLAMVDHDHIVTIYQMDEERGTMYLAMPYLQGETLDARLAAKTRLPLADCLRITRQIALGLAAAHHRGVIHRDIKPSNIWLEEGSDRVKILDFGLAQDSKAETLLTQEGSVVGTPAYMAPEQAQGIKVDHRADLFSLGCVLYQMICGMSPFARK